MDEIKNYYNEDLKIYRDCLKKKKIDFKKLIAQLSDAPSSPISPTV